MYWSYASLIDLSIYFKNSVIVENSDYALARYSIRRSDILYNSSVEVISIVAFTELFIANSTCVRYSD
jgi:hypothetical protein